MFKRNLFWGSCMASILKVSESCYIMYNNDKCCFFIFQSFLFHQLRSHLHLRERGSVTHATSLSSSITSTGKCAILTASRNNSSLNVLASLEIKSRQACMLILNLHIGIFVTIQPFHTFGQSSVCVFTESKSICKRVVVCVQSNVSLACRIWGSWTVRPLNRQKLILYCLQQNCCAVKLQIQKNGCTFYQRHTKMDVSQPKMVPFSFYKVATWKYSLPGSIGRTVLFERIRYFSQC